MIFLTVGMRLPFDRLVMAMDSWAAAHPEVPVFGQILKRTSVCLGDPYVPRHFEHAAEIDPATLARHVKAARIIVGHAGTGTLITAMTHGKPLVMMARRADLREVTNDHQLATARHLGGLAGVHLVETAQDLGDTLDQLLALPDARGARPSQADESLIRAIRAEILRSR